MKNSIINFRNAIIALLMIVLNGAPALAEAPWTVNPADYRYDMSLYLDVSFIDTPMDYSEYWVGAFSGDECRGVGEVLDLGEGKQCLYMRVRSNVAEGETMTFKYYNIATGETMPVHNVSFKFESNGRLGYPSDPYKVKIILHYNIEISAGEGGTVEGAGGLIPERTWLTVAASPRRGYHFVKWSDGDTENPRNIYVEKDLSIEAEFVVNTYKLTYMVDGEMYKEYDVDYLAAITPEAEPEKEGYTFSGWDNVPETMPYNDVTVSGTFSINSYNAVFKIGEEFTETLVIEYMQPVTAPEAPVKEGYTFDGWKDVPETMPAHDIEILGSYTVNTYKLTYMVDGEKYKEYEVDYGTAITPEALPEKEGYTFSGWQNLPETMPASDVTVTGEFSINSYKAVFKIGDEIIDTVEVVYGESITEPAAPEKEGYTFDGWQDVPETMPAHDIEILGSYTVNTYKLTYMVDGEMYKEYEVDYGTEIVPEAAPEKEGYTFSGWDEVPATMPAYDMTVNGSFLINAYNAVFKIGDDVIETLVIEFGQPVTAPEAPEKEGYTFDGWKDVPETMPAHDIEILGSYTVNTYKLTYMVDGELYKEVEVEYGAEIVPEVPEKEGYSFSGWDNLPETMPAYDVTVNGSFSINSYTLYLYLNDELYHSELVVYGMPIYIEDPEVPEDMKFEGWKTEIPETMPAHDVHIYGTYSPINSVESIEIDDNAAVTVVSITGQTLYRNAVWSEVKDKLENGLYIVNGVKYLIRK